MNIRESTISKHSALTFVSAFWGQIELNYNVKVFFSCILFTCDGSLLLLWFTTVK